MKLFFIDQEASELASKNSDIIDNIRKQLLRIEGIDETDNPDSADALIINEENSFKNFHYEKRILNDPLISKYLHKTFTVNNDDCATGLLPGLYTSLPSTRFDADLYAVVPFFDFYNEKVFQHQKIAFECEYLAGWKGNISSSMLRRRLLKLFANRKGYQIETSDSWLNHSDKEKLEFVAILLNSKFSLCPSGYSPATFRIYESMYLARCPVIISDDICLPEGPDWKSCTILLKENELVKLNEILLQSEDRAEEMGNRARAIWLENFHGDKLYEYCAKHLIRLVQQGKGRENDEIMELWQSSKFRRSNRWTIPQRIQNRFNRIFRS